MAAIGALEASGGGGGGGGSFLMVNIIRSGGDEFEADHTRAEVLEALQNGPVFCNYSGCLGVFTQEEGYPELYANVLYASPAVSPHVLTIIYMYFQYDDNGDFTGLETTAEI